MRTFMRRTVFAVAVLAVFVLVSVGCSSDNDSPVDAPTTPTLEENKITPPVLTTTTTVPATTTTEAPPVTSTTTATPTETTATPTTNTTIPEGNDATPQENTAPNTPSDTGDGDTADSDTTAGIPSDSADEPAVETETELPELTTVIEDIAESVKDGTTKELLEATLSKFAELFTGVTGFPKLPDTFIDCLTVADCPTESPTLTLPTP